MKLNESPSLRLLFHFILFPSFFTHHYAEFASNNNLIFNNTHILKRRHMTNDYRGSMDDSFFVSLFLSSFFFDFVIFGGYDGA